MKLPSLRAAGVPRPLRWLVYGVVAVVAFKVAMLVLVALAVAVALAFKIAVVVALGVVVYALLKRR